MKQIRGLAASDGCMMGTVFVSAPVSVEVEKRTPPHMDLEQERFEAARRAYAERLRALAERSEGDAEAVSILKAYEEILQDDEFFGDVKRKAVQEQTNIDYVLEQEKQRTVALFEGMDDAYLKERATDIANVCNELIFIMQKKDTSLSVESTGGKVIVFAEDLTPEQTMKLDKQVLGGFVTERGGVTAHTAILARSLGIPAVVGARGVLREACGSETAIVYGSTGDVILAPDEAAVAQYHRQKREDEERAENLECFRMPPAVTKDGHRMHVMLNCGRDLPQRLDASDGIGLLRTEYIYMDAETYPSEEGQFAIYREAAEQAEEKELVIRTLDIGADKQASYMPPVQEQNPFLGHRGIRRSLAEPQILRTQLRAILRAGVYGNVKVMFPMIVRIEEWEQAAQVLEDAKQALREEGVPFREDMPAGVMIETPAAVWLAADLARRVDFFSIGTNDLIQYTTASDRMNDTVQHLYDAFNPAVLRAVHQVCRAAQREGIEVAICGEAAREPLLIPLWAAMGVNALSVAEPELARTKYRISRVTKQHAENQLEEILNLDTSVSVKSALERLIK